jgi:energy-coupling factor transporter ATP-binding protein EcfA2
MACRCGCRRCGSFTRARNAATLILDEPDVYLHADLQRRLIRCLNVGRSQVIVATLSVEIISEVVPDQILVVDKRRPAYDIHRQSARRAAARRPARRRFTISRLRDCGTPVDVWAVEEKTYESSSTCMPRCSRSPRTPSTHCRTLNLEVGQGGSSILHLPALLRNAAGEQITFYCLLDRDYRVQQQIQATIRRRN